MSKERVMLLIDADNVSVDIIEQAVHLLHKQHGGVHVRRAYCTAEGALKHQAVFRRLGIKPMVNLATGKNSTDIALAVDAIDLVLAERPDVVVIASSDSDFAPLVQRLREKGCEVRGIGQRGKTGDETQEVYDDYTVLEHRRPAAGGGATHRAAAARTPAHKAAPAAAPKPARKSRSGRGRDRAAPAAEMVLPPAEPASRLEAPPAPSPAAEPVPAPEPAPVPAPAPAVDMLDTASLLPAAAAATPRKKPAARKTTVAKTARKSTAAAGKPAPVDDAVATEAAAAPAVADAAAAQVDAGPAAGATPVAKTPRPRAPRKTAAGKSAAAKAKAAPAPAPAPQPPPSPAPAPAPEPAAPPARAAMAPVAAGAGRGGVDAGGGRTSVDAVLDCLPELRAGQSLALNVAVQRLREAQLLGRNSSSLKLFSQLGPRFELMPTGKPSLVRLRG